MELVFFSLFYSRKRLHLEVSSNFVPEVGPQAHSGSRLCLFGKTLEEGPLPLYHTNARRQARLLNLSILICLLNMFWELFALSIFNGCHSPKC